MPSSPEDYGYRLWNDDEWDMTWEGEETGTHINAMRDEATDEWHLVARPGDMMGNTEEIGTYPSKEAARKAAAEWARDHANPSSGVTGVLD